MVTARLSLPASNSCCWGVDSRELLRRLEAVWPLRTLLLVIRTLCPKRSLTVECEDSWDSSRLSVCARLIRSSFVIGLDLKVTAQERVLSSGLRVLSSWASWMNEEEQETQSLGEKGFYAYERIMSSSARRVAASRRMNALWGLPVTVIMYQKMRCPARCPCLLSA